MLASLLAHFSWHRRGSRWIPPRVFESSWKEFNAVLQFSVNTAYPRYSLLSHPFQTTSCVYCIPSSLPLDLVALGAEPVYFLLYLDERESCFGRDQAPTRWGVVQNQEWTGVIANGN